MRCAKTVKYTPDFKDVGEGAGRKEESITLIIFMLVTCSIFVILGSIKYILKINFTCSFLVLNVAARKRKTT